MKLSYLLPIAIFAFLVGMFWQGLGRDTHNVPSALIGKPVPELEVFAGEDGNLGPNDFKGQVSLLNIWASWCVSCQAEHAFWMQLKQENIKLYGLAYKDNVADADNMLTQLGNPYNKVAYDLRGRAAIEWGVYATPETFVIDRQGIIRHKHIGVVDKRVWQDELLPIIKKLS